MFDDIRPYNESEVPAAMQRIAADALFPKLCEFVFPGQDVEALRQKVAALQTVDDFQRECMYVFNKQVVARSIDAFSYDGLSRIEKGKPYLYVSNHRDIVLDSSLLQNVLFENGFGTTEITFGANLMQGQLIIDIGKSNKMFRVERGATPKEFYRLSQHLSEYIRAAIIDNHHSVWIAQRNGRTKDGDDRTDQGIIKMFAMSNRSDDKIAALADLNLLPIAVSYEWEPCDMLKAFELYVSRSQKYVKRPGEDVNSILQGIMNPKGRVHFEICPPIDPSELMGFEHNTQNEYHLRVAQLIDRRIHVHYRLWPNNYIAYDLLYGCTTYRRLYSATEKRCFEERLALLKETAWEALPHQEIDMDVLTEIFLKIYANPVNNKKYND